MSREIIVAEPHGFCGTPQGFGVARAIFLAEQTAKQYPGKTYLLGEIVHNHHVCDHLENEFGVQTVNSLKEIPNGATVIIRAHGAVPGTYQEAQAKNLNIVDATCPLVVQVHREVKELAADGKQIVYIASSYQHDEALGVLGEAPKNITLTTLKDLDKLEIADPNKTVVLTQTTLSILETKSALEKLQKRCPNLIIKPHICMATTQRQEAVIKLAKEVGFVVIVGSQTSSNSIRLKEAAEQAGARAHIVDSAKDLNPIWFKSVNKAAVSSGASTPEDILNEVVVAIKNY